MSDARQEQVAEYMARSIERAYAMCAGHEEERDPLDFLVAQAVAELTLIRQALERRESEPDEPWQ